MVCKKFQLTLDLEHVIAIELQDSEEHIFERMVFSDENDNIYKDEAYKKEHKDYYIHDIHEDIVYKDIVYTRRIFKKIENKYFINNRSVDQVVGELMALIQNMSVNKCGQKQGVELYKRLAYLLCVYLLHLVPGA